MLTAFFFIVGAVIWPLHSQAGTSDNLAYTTVQVHRGTVNLKATETGTLQAYSITPVLAGTQGQISGAIPEVGEKVSRGQSLIRLKSRTLAATLTRDRLAVQRAQLKLDYGQHASASPALLHHLQNDEIAVAQDQSTLALDQSALRLSTVTAQTYGTVTQMSVTPGQQVGNGQVLLRLVNGSSMQLSAVTFGSIKGLTVGTPASIMLANGQRTDGTVASFSTAGSRAGRADGHSVTVEVPNPGVVTPGGYVTAWVKKNDANFTLGGYLQPAHLLTVTAPLAGKVSRLDVGTGSRVKAGQPLVTIAPTTAANRVGQDQLALRRDEIALQTDSKQLDLSQGQNQHADALLETDLAQAEVSLQSDLAAEERLNILAPVSGVITDVPAHIQLGVHVGKFTEVARVADLAKLLLMVNVGQSHVNDIRLGQKVQVTSTGAPGGTFQGTVTDISVIGSGQNGVTSFPVTITIDHPGQLRPGMAAVAEFTFKSLRDVLYVPDVAIHEQNGTPFVFLLQTGGVVAGVPITIGLETDTDAQVLHGLHSGEVVITSGYQDTGTQKRRLNVRGQVLHRHGPRRVRRGRPKR